MQVRSIPLGLLFPAPYSGNLLSFAFQNVMTLPNSFFSIIALLIVWSIVGTLLYAIISYSLLRFKENKTYKKSKSVKSAAQVTESYVLAEAEHPEAPLSAIEADTLPVTAQTEAFIAAPPLELPEPSAVPVPEFSIPAPTPHEVPVVLVNSKNPPPLPHLDTIAVPTVVPNLPKIEKTDFLKEIPIEPVPTNASEEVVEVPLTTIISVQPHASPETVVTTPTQTPIEEIPVEVPSIEAVAHPIEITVTEPELGAARAVEVVQKSQLEVPSVEVPKLVVETHPEPVLSAVDLFEEPLSEVVDEDFQEPASDVVETVVAETKLVEETTAPFEAIAETEALKDTTTEAPKKHRLSLVSIDLTEVKKAQSPAEAAAVENQQPTPAPSIEALKINAPETETPAPPPVEVVAETSPVTPQVPKAIPQKALWS